MTETLTFSYSARLTDQATFNGTVVLWDWRHGLRQTEEQAAWAWVRGLLNVPGEWKCSVWLAGLRLETKTIGVEEVDGTLFRHDRKETT